MKHFLSKHPKVARARVYTHVCLCARAGLRLLQVRQRPTLNLSIQTFSTCLFVLRTARRDPAKKQRMSKQILPKASSSVWCLKCLPVCLQRLRVPRVNKDPSCTKTHLAETGTGSSLVTTTPSKWWRPSCCFPFFLEEIY